MEVHALTEAEREQMLEQAFSKMKIERKHLSQEELEKEIIDYLGKKQACSLATCGKNGVPRISVVDYVNDGTTIYIFSEGGDKFNNLKENNKVAIGIGTSAQTFRSVRGINLWGIAEVFTEDTLEFTHGMKLFSHIIKDMEKEMGTPIKIPTGILRMIRVTPTKIIYCHNNKGIANAHWENR